MSDIVSNTAAAAAAGLGILKKQQDLIHTPQQQANASAKTDAEIRDDATEAVRNEDIEEIRKQAAE